MAFKSNDRTFEKVYGIFDKRDYFNAQGLAKVQIGNFERALQKNDKGAQQILDKFKGDMGKAKDYITQVITDRKKEQAFNDYKAFKAAVDSIQKGKPQYGAVDLVKSRIHNSSQKYTIALYSALRNKKFTKWKDVHNDVDDLIGEGFKSDAQRKAAFANGYEEKGKKKNESVNEIDTKKANLLRTNMPGYVGPKFAKKASDEDILAMADLKDQKAKIYNRYVKVVDDAIAKLQKKYRIKESVNEANARLNKKVKSYLDDYLRGEKKNSPEHQETIMLIMRGALTDANFHSEARQLSKYFPKAGKKYIGTPMEDVIEDKGVQIAKWAKWDGYDIIDAFAFYTSMSIGGSFGAKFQSLKESVNEMQVVNKKTGKDITRHVLDLLSGKIDKKKFEKLTGLKKESVDGLPQGYNPTVENKKEVEQIAKKTKSETAFYDVLSKIEKKYGKRNYRIWLEKSLKDLGVNAKHYDYRTNAAAEEKLYQLTK